MQIEKGCLIVGVTFEGELHHDFELRPQLVRDTVDIFDDPALAARAERNNQFFAACLFAGRIMSLGTIPKDEITVDLVLNMDQDDYNEVVSAGERLERRMATFRGEAKGDQEDNPGAAEVRLQEEGSGSDVGEGGGRLSGGVYRDHEGRPEGAEVQGTEGRKVRQQ